MVYILLIEFLLFSFLTFLKDISANDTEVINFVKRRHAKANPNFTSSPQFLQLLRKVQKNIQRDVENKYVFVKDLTDELKAYNIKHSKTIKSKPDSDPESTDTSGAGPSNCKVDLATTNNQKTMDLKRNRGASNDDTGCGPQSKKIRTAPPVHNQDRSNAVRNEDEIVFIDFPKRSGVDVAGRGDVIEVLSTSDNDGSV